MGGTTKEQIAEESELRGVRVHSEPPRLMTEFDIRESNHFLGRSKRARHREKVDNAPVLPFSMLVAKSVSRKDYLGNPRAMDAYWKEWSNLERKGVWRWDELTDWSDAVKYHPQRQSSSGTRY